jgi:hypothetical protein
MKKYLLYLFISIFPSILFAQRGYYSKDTIMVAGIKLVDKGDLNYKICSVKKGDKIIQFTSDQIDSYGFNDRRFYKAFTIEVNGKQERYFFQRLVQGRVNLFYAVIEGKNKYFLNKNLQSNLLEIPQSLNANKVFVESILTDCPQAIENTPYVRSKKNDLMRYIKDYNSCANRPFLRTRYGFGLGAKSFNLNAIDFTYAYPVSGNINSMGYSLGAFADIPFAAANLSIHPELNLEHFSNSKSYINGQDYNLVLNSVSLNIPVYVRYTVLKKFLSPYFQIGPVYSQSIHRNANLYRYFNVDNDIFIEINDSRLLQNSMAGFSAGTGLILNYGSKYSWLAEFNFIKMNNLISKYNIYSRYDIAFKIGILF